MELLLVVNVNYLRYVSVDISVNIIGIEFLRCQFLFDFWFGVTASQNPFKEFRCINGLSAKFRIIIT